MTGKPAQPFLLRPLSSASLAASWAAPVDHSPAVLPRTSNVMKEAEASTPDSCRFMVPTNKCGLSPSTLPGVVLGPGNVQPGAADPRAQVSPIRCQTWPGVSVGRARSLWEGPSATSRASVKLLCASGQGYPCLLQRAGRLWNESALAAHRCPSGHHSSHQLPSAGFSRHPPAHWSRPRGAAAELLPCRPGPRVPLGSPRSRESTQGRSTVSSVCTLTHKPTTHQLALTCLDNSL